MTSRKPISTGADSRRRRDFIRQQIVDDLASGRADEIVTRFPPEPNGFLHIGHAKSIALNFAVADEFGGRCLLRFDDTNPAAESGEFYQAILEDVRWLGFEPAEVTHASDHFEQLFTWAETLTRDGLAYVDDQDAATISAQRGRFGTPGVASPHRERDAQTNLELLHQMRAGRFADGSRVLRAKIDMTAGEIAMRDPVLYRIRRVPHARTGADWLIYPTYDWAHGQVDAIEGISHSIASLEFASHRGLYEWFLDHIDLPSRRPRQLEFARLEMTHTVTSKRRLRRVVEDGTVDGWDDPRLPTLRGMARRGYRPGPIRAFLDHVGVAKTNSVVDFQLFESFIRADANLNARRRMVVLDPVRLVITDWPAGTEFEARIANNPERPEAGDRTVAFPGTVWVERDDVQVSPAPGFRRLAPGREVRLRNAFLVTVTEILTDDDGTVTEVRCTHDPESAGGSAPDKRKVGATLHWVSTEHAVDREVRTYLPLFREQPVTIDDDQAGDAESSINAGSLSSVVAHCEPMIAEVERGELVQFERLGYFVADPQNAGLFHSTVGLRDEWAREQRRQAQSR